MFMLIDFQGLVHFLERPG
uniref:Uncharacterized protein n=1 Tax=Anguilla anguilla TaxID=7936 RepID=A0A0E9UDY4_ANGAN